MRTFLSIAIVCCLSAQARAQQSFTQAQIDEAIKTTTVEVDRAKQLAERDAEIHRLNEEITRLRAARPDGDTQLVVEARFIELSADKFNSYIVGGTRSALNPFLYPKTKGNPETAKVNSLPIIVCDADSPVLEQIELWLADPAKPAKVLGSPTITTLLEKPAHLKLGNEFPILVPGALGSTTIEYRFYGLQVDAIGSLRDDGKLLLQIRPRQSEIDRGRSVSINGQEIPGLTVRECATDLFVSPGQTIVIGGMIRSRTVTTQPSRFLQAAKIKEEETELLIVLSAEALPSDGK